MDDNKCVICKNCFSKPRMLPCLHTFCENCLEKLCETGDTIKCPTCEEIFPAKKDDVKHLFPLDLRKSHEVNISMIKDKISGPIHHQCCAVCRQEEVAAYCIDTNAYLCVNCTQYHEQNLKMQMVPVVQQMSECSTLQINHQDQCPRHKNMLLDVYCPDCKVLICTTCKDGGRHRQHRDSCVLIDEIAEHEYEKLRPYREVCEVTKKLLLDEAIVMSEKVLKDVETQKEEVDEQIREGLELVCDQLLKQNADIYSKKVAALKPQIKHLKAVRSGLSDTMSKIDSLKSYTPSEKLSIHQAVLDRALRMKERVNECESMLVPSTSANITSYISSKEVVAKMIKLGRVTAGSHHPPSKCDAGCLPLAVVGHTRKITVTAVDEEGKPFRHEIQQVEVILSSVRSKLRVVGDIKDHNNGSYTVKFKPTTPGEHQLKVTVASVDCRGSPFRYFVHDPRLIPYTEHKTPPREILTSSRPMDVAEIEEGILAVAEYGSHTVSLYSMDSRKVHVFGTANSGGHADRQFHSPSALAVGNNLLYVCESGNHRVQVINWCKRSFLFKFGSKGKRDGQFSNPRGIVTDGSGMVYVADSGNNRIQVFSEDGKFSYAFTCKQPWGLAFDLHGHLHVASNRSNIIEMYTPEGTKLASYGTGVVKSPAGIGINGEGYIAISEWGGHNRIWIYGPEFKVVHTIAHMLKKGGGVASDNSGDFWLIDYANNRITTY